MTTRRAFLKGAGLIVAAPAIVRAESLMKVFVPPERKILEPIRMGNYLLYQDAEGTIPVTAEGQPVGLAKHSEGLVFNMAQTRIDCRPTLRKGALCFDGGETLTLPPGIIIGAY